MQAKSLPPDDDKSPRSHQDVRHGDFREKPEPHLAATPVEGTHNCQPIGEEPDMTDQSFWGFGFGRNPKLRAADADRDAVADQIRRAHTAGRLDTIELQQRLERCYEAKTLGELEQLVTDLPREGPEERARPRLGPMRWRLAPLILALIALIAICATTHHHAFWLLIPLVILVYRMCWWRWRPSRMAGGSGPGTWL
jgi:hypothetical protein